MPIEFDCPQCGKLLRTADETAGRAAKCPACGTVMTVPERSAAERMEAVSMRPMDEPFGDSEEAVNPYQAPGEEVGMSPFHSSVPASERVRAPAICLIVLASVGLITYLGIILMYGGIFIAVMNDPQFQQNPGDPTIGFAMMIGYGVVGLALMILTFFGGIKMKNLEGYGLAMTAAVLMVIPCLSPCGFLGMPFGIWAIVVLADSDVRNAFG